MNSIRYSIALDCIILERGQHIHYIEHQPNAVETLFRILRRYAELDKEGQNEADHRIPAEQAKRLQEQFAAAGGQTQYLTRAGKKQLKLEDLDLEI